MASSKPRSRRSLLRRLRTWWTKRWNWLAEHWRLTTGLIAGVALLANNIDIIDRLVFPNSRTTFRVAGVDANKIQLTILNDGKRTARILGFHLHLAPSLRVRDPEIRFADRVNDVLPVVETGKTDLAITTTEVFGADKPGSGGRYCKAEIMNMLPSATARLEMDVEESGKWWKSYVRGPFVATRTETFPAREIERFIDGRMPDYDEACP